LAGVSNGGALAGAVLVRENAAAVARRMTRFIDSLFRPDWLIERPVYRP
jgi:hypothetical protein